MNQNKKNSQVFLRFLWLRAIAELKADVRNSYFGLAWWFLDPLIYMGVFYVVFGLGLRAGGNNFLQFLLVGLVVWRWFDTGVKKAGSSISAYKSLILQLYIPKIILPLIPIISNTIRFMIVYVILVFYLFVSSSLKVGTIFWLIPVLLGQLLLIHGAGMLLAAITPFAQDVKRISDYGISLLFFMSGIFYSIQTMSERNYGLFLCNPIAYFIEAQRLVLLQGRVPDLYYLSVHVLISLLAISLACFMLVKFDKKYPVLN